MKKTILPSIVTLFVITASWCQAQQPILWGMTSAGGPYGGGGIFNYNSGTDSETVAHDFGIGTDGIDPFGSLIKASNGLLYGMTQAGGATYNGGIIFSYNILTGIETDLHDFNGSDTDGYGPIGSLLQASNGLLYGMAQSSGFHDGGIIFSYNISTGKETDIYDFGSISYDGLYPTGSLIQVNDSLLYGMTSQGGSNNSGAIFSFNISTGAETVLWDFGNGNDGYLPNGSLLQAGNGLLYGMTQYGGGVGDTGTIFSFNISIDTEIVVYSFVGGNDGNQPMGSLMQASDSLLYGMTEAGGGNAVGIIFSYNIATGNETVLWNFGNGTDGIQPQGSLIQASNGLLYGTTLLGGAYTGGILLSYNIATGTETDIHDFGISPDGSLPAGDLLEDDAVPQPLDLQCDGRDQHSIYLIAKGGALYRIDSVDTNPTAPVTLVSNDTSTADGISINKNLDTGSGDMTMYIVDSTGEYYYWTGANWVDTHHNSGGVYALNPGGTDNYIFNIDVYYGILYRYDGTGTGTRLLTVPIGFVAFPDVATDINGNFYLYYPSEAQIIAYTPDGVPIETLVVNGGNGGGGFCIIGSKFFITLGYPPIQTLLQGTIINNHNVVMSFAASLPSTYTQIIDMASCPEAANPLAVFEVPEAPHFIIYPNPASDKAIVKMDNTDAIDITDCMGRKITTINTRGLTQYQLSLAGWTQGIYIVTATAADGLVAHISLVVQ